MSDTSRPKYSLSWTLHGLAFLLAALMLLAGCQPGSQRSTAWPMAEVARDVENNARLSIFLNLKEADGPAVRLEIADLQILSDGGVWLPISSRPLTLDSETIGATQVFLGGRAVPTGHYHRLRFAIAEATVLRAGGRYERAPVDSPLLELELTSPLGLGPDDSSSLFLVWDVQGSLEHAGGLHPMMTIAPQLRQLLVDLIYVACPDIDTVFVIRSDKAWVADSFGLRGQPTFLAMDPDPSRRRLYVLASREAAIKVVDLSSQRVIDSFHIPLTAIPTFMTISADGKWAYVLDERNSYLNQIDLATGRSVRRVRLRYRPQYAAFLVEQNLLAVSAGLSQTVSLHNPTDLTEVGTILTGNSPQGVLSSAGQFYVAESGDHTVSVFDLANRRRQNRLDVGLSPRRLLFNGAQIYVSNYDDRSLSVLFPGQLGSVREIHGLGRPLEMIYDQAYRRVYVGDEQAGGLAIIDSTGNQLTGYIVLGARPLGLAVLP